MIRSGPALAVVLFAALGVVQQAEAAAARKPAARAARPGFSRYIEDLRVMPELKEVRGSVVQLSPGRRVEVRMEGSVGASVVRSFYAAVLPQEGWRRSDDQPYLYHRGSEQLTYVLAPRMSSSGVEVVFRISPDPAAAPAAAQP